jgi:hypothetical protein
MCSSGISGKVPVPSDNQTSSSVIVRRTLSHIPYTFTDGTGTLKKAQFQLKRFSAFGI